MTAYNLYEEKALFDRIADGEEVAFGILFNLYKSKLYRFTLRICKSEDVAEELVHDVFLKIWNNRDLHHNIDHPATYMYTIAKNKAMDHLRKVACDARLMGQLWHTLSESNDVTQEAVEANECYSLVKTALSKLTPQKQLIYRLSREDGLNHEQIAQQLNISKSTVNNHLVGSLKHIKSFLIKNGSESAAVLITIFMFT
jgi:RNA polymerase sigma-70 factor (ECF subfamily)